MTPKQKRVLDFIEDYISRNKIAPSYREIAAGVGCPSMSWVWRQVVSLEEQGHLTTTPGRIRSIQLTGSVEKWAERLLDNIVSEDPDKDRVVVRAQDIAKLDLALSARRKSAA